MAKGGDRTLKKKEKRRNEERSRAVKEEEREGVPRRISIFGPLAH